MPGEGRPEPVFSASQVTEDTGNAKTDMSSSLGFQMGGHRASSSCWSARKPYSKLHNSMLRTSVLIPNALAATSPLRSGIHFLHLDTAPVSIPTILLYTFSHIPGIVSLASLPVPLSGLT